MKIFKTLSKRGLALFLALTMCMSLLPATALAAEVENFTAPHTHNQDGWSCQRGESMCLLEEAHIHTDACYASVKATEDQEPNTLLDQFGNYVQGAIGWITGQAAPEAEKKLVCTVPENHTHSDACYQWTCTAPVAIPAAVQAFLDAAAKIPAEITVENAAEVEVLLNAAQEAYAVLDYEDLAREDVLAAAETLMNAAAALEQVKNAEPAAPVIPEGATVVELAKLPAAAQKAPMSVWNLFGLVRDNYQDVLGGNFPETLTFVGENGTETVQYADTQESGPAVVQLTADSILYNGVPVTAYFQGVVLGTDDVQTLASEREQASRWPTQNQIVFDLNSGNGRVDPVSYEQGVPASLPDGTGIEREGYTLLGWSKNKDSNTVSGGTAPTVYNLGGSIVENGTGCVTLYAVWGQSSGGQSGDIQIAIRADGIVPDEPSIQNADYYYFVKLVSVDVLEYFKPAHTVSGTAAVEARLTDTFRKYVDDHVNDEAIKGHYDPATQYIEWYVIKYQGNDKAWHIDGVVRDKAKVNLHYDKNAPTGMTVEGLAPDGVQVAVGGSTTVGQGTLRVTGYKFMGWNTAADGNGTTYKAGDSIILSEHTTLYAQWEIDSDNTKELSYTVEYYKDNEIVSVDTQVVKKTVWVNADTLPVDKSNLHPTDKYPGYRFENTDPATIPSSVAGGAVIKVYYVRSSYTVTFNSNGGSDVKSQTVQSNEQATEPEAPQKDKYNFAGWYTNEDLTNRYDFDTPVAADITLYAKWTEKQVTITYEVIDGNDTSGNTVQVVGSDTPGRSGSETVKVSEGPVGATATAAEGWKFVGWYSDLACANQVCADNSYQPGSVAEDTTYYAKFVKLYTVFVSGDDGVKSKSVASGDERNATSLAVTSGSSATVSWTLEDNYVLDSITVDGGKQDISGNQTSLTLNNILKNTEVVITTKLKPVTYTVEYYYQNQETGAFEKDSTSTDRTGNVTQPASVTDTDKVPNRTGYVLDEANLGNVWEIKNLTETGNVLKVYFKLQYTLTVTAGPGVTVTAPATTPFTYDWSDTPQTVIFTLAEGYTLTGITVDGTQEANPDSPITVDSKSSHTVIINATNQYGYTVKFYKDAVDDSTEVGTGTFLGAVTGTGTFGDVIAEIRGLNLNAGRPSTSGYTGDGVVIDADSSKTITPQSEANVIHVVYSKDQLSYSIVKHFLDRKDKEVGTENVSIHEKAVYGTLIATLISSYTSPQIYRDTTYLYDTSKTTVGESLVIAETQLTTDNAVIHLYYDVDALGGTPDGTADKNQALVTYQGVNGNVSPSSAVVTLEDGVGYLANDQLPNAQPSVGYDAESAKWTVGGKDATAPTIKTRIVADITYIVEFSKATHTITVTVENGTATPADASIKVDYGASQTISFGAKAGYALDTVTVDGLPAELTNSSYTFTEVTGDHSITVVYAADEIGPDGEPDGIPDKYQVTFTFEAEEGGTVSSAKLVKTITVDGKPAESGTVSITKNDEVCAVPNENYSMGQWKSDSFNSPYTTDAAELTGNCMVEGGNTYAFTASFQKNSVSYKVVQHFIGGRTPTAMDAFNGSADPDVQVVDLITDDLKAGKLQSSEKYVYVEAETTLNGELLTESSKLEAGSANQIDMYFYVDNLDGKNNSLTGGDGIPDKDQAVVRYNAFTPLFGTVSKSLEVVTFGENDTAKAAEGSEAAGKEGYAFAYWSKGEAGTEKDAVSFDAEYAPDEIKREDDLTFWAVFLGDKKGTDPANPNKPDGVPDQYQVKVTYTATNGAVSFGETYVTLLDGNGNPAKNGTGHLTSEQIPGATPDAGYTGETWAAQKPTTSVAITGDTEFHVTWSKGSFQYKVNYLNEEDGNAIQNAKVETAEFESEITSESVKAEINGYVFDHAGVDKITIGADETKNVINLYYAVDAIGTDPENPDQPDGTPDKYQITFTYVAGNGGTVTGTTKEVATRLDSEGKWSLTAEVSPKAEVTAHPNEGHLFVDWTDGKGSLVNTGDIKARAYDKDTRFTANFVKEPTVTIKYVSANAAMGTVTPAEETIQALRGNASGSTATPALGYKFVNWTDESGKEAGTEPNFVPDRAHGEGTYYEAATYTANFAKRNDLDYTVNYHYDNTVETETGKGEFEAAIPYTAASPKTYNNQNYVLERVEGGEKKIGVNAAENVVDVYYTLDVIGTTPENPGQPDGTPDKYQITVTFRAVNGTVDGEEAKRVVLDKLDANGALAEDGTAVLTAANIPAASANTGYTEGTWDVEPAAGTELKQDTAFTITYRQLGQYTVTYVTNGQRPDGYTAPAAVNVTEGGTHAIVAAPANRAGTYNGDAGTFTFSGWSRTGTITVNGNVTITGTWTFTPSAPNQYTVTYSVTGAIPAGYVPPAVAVVTAGGTFTVAANPAAQAGYYNGIYGTFTFGGWSQTGAVVVNGNMIINGTWYFTAAYDPDPDPYPDPDPDPDPDPVPTPTPPVTIPDDPTPTAPAPDDLVTIVDENVPLAAPGLNSTDHFDYIKGYGDGTVKPERNITRAEVATIFFRLMTNEYRTESWATENGFTDVKVGDWFNNAISTSAKAGILKGYEDGSFQPNKDITRAEFATIAARFASDVVPSGGMFEDIEGHWAQENIERASAAGWIRGSEGKFRPNDMITRAEVITAINRMLDRVPDVEHMHDDMKTFVDNTPDKWYYAAVQEATNSHDYERGENGASEVWTEILPERDWAALEKEWATAASAPVTNVAPSTDEGKKEDGAEDEGEAKTEPETTGDGEN